MTPKLIEEKTYDGINYCIEEVSDMNGMNFFQLVRIKGEEVEPIMRSFYLGDVQEKFDLIGANHE